MANAFNSAQNDIEAQRRAAVAAIAAGGAQGAQAFSQGQQQIEAARTAAMNAALSEAAQRGQGNLGGLVGGIVGSPYSQLKAGLASSAASHAADFANQGAAADTYFRQLGSAVPMAASALEGKIAAAKAKAASANQLSDSELRTRLLGAGELALAGEQSQQQAGHHLFQTQVAGLKGQLKGVTQELAKVQQRWLNNEPIRPGKMQALKQQATELETQLAQARKQRAPYTESLKTLGTDAGRQQGIAVLARQAGIDAGEDPNRIAGLIQMPKAPAAKALGNVRAVSDAARQLGIRPRRLRKITANTEFSTITTAIQDDLKKGVPFAVTAKNLALYKPGHLGRIKALALAMYQPAFAAQG